MSHLSELAGKEQYAHARLKNPDHSLYILADITIVFASALVPLSLYKHTVLI